MAISTHQEGGPERNIRGWDWWRVKSICPPAKNSSSILAVPTGHRELKFRLPHKNCTRLQRGNGEPEARGIEPLLIIQPKLGLWSNWKPNWYIYKDMSSKPIGLPWIFPQNWITEGKLCISSNALINALTIRID